MRKASLIMIIFFLSLSVLVSSCGKNEESSIGSFSKCLASKEVKFYGAFWCPHCNSQKAMFGDSFKNIDYVECSQPDRSQNQACKDAKINAYPTWEFNDGSRIEGEMTFLQLEQKTGCVLSG